MGARRGPRSRRRRGEALKRVYRDAIKAVLDHEVPRQLDGFSVFPLKLTKAERSASTLFAGSRLYARAVGDARLFIHVIPHRGQERILAEVGWSASGRFPAALSSHGPVREPADEMLESAWLIDFGTLYHRKYGRGFLGWDAWRCSLDADHPDFLKTFAAEDALPVSEDEADGRAEAAVSACIADLKDVALPYLDRWVAMRASRS